MVGIHIIQGQVGGSFEFTLPLLTEGQIENHSMVKSNFIYHYQSHWSFDLQRVLLQKVPVAERKI